MVDNFAFSQSSLKVINLFLLREYERQMSFTPSTCKKLMYVKVATDKKE